MGYVLKHSIGKSNDNYVFWGQIQFEFEAKKNPAPLNYFHLYTEQYNNLLNNRNQLNSFFFQVYAVWSIRFLPLTSSFVLINSREQQNQRVVAPLITHTYRLKSSRHCERNVCLKLRYTHLITYFISHSSISFKYLSKTCICFQLDYTVIFTSIFDLKWYLSYQKLQQEIDLYIRSSFWI